MNRLALLMSTTALMLTACASEQDAVDPAAEADAFAQRIKGDAATASPPSGPTPQATAAPRIAQPLPGAAPGAFMPGTATDPAAATCGANLMGPFLGKLADEPTRLAIVKTLGRSNDVRFVAFGSAGFVNPDPTSQRINLMLDQQGIIRDARCG